jgi:CheY-like chemotaxis protein
MTQRAEEKGLRLQVNIQEDIPRYIKSDNLKLRQILINIIGNAIKFTDKGGISLNVNIKQQDKMSYLIFEIVDSGIGIHKDEISTIFTPFHQISTGSNLQKGTGLGLAISKQFTELLGGEISVKNNANRGTTFTVKLPLLVSGQGSSSGITNEFSFVKSIKPEYSELKILIAEDQIENWMLLQRIHEKVGIKVRIAENGEEAIEIFKSWQPNLIWMDIQMPVKNGLEATKEIRGLSNGDQVKIIGLSAHVFKDEIESTLDTGMDGFIKKPFKFHEIYETLNEQVGVDFTFSDQKSEFKAPKLSPDLFHNIEKSKLIELRDSIKNLDDERISNSINKIALTESELANMLSYYAENLHYTLLYNTINDYLKKQ